MSYDLDTVYVVSLGLFVGLIVIPIRDWATRRKPAANPASFLWGWFAMTLSMVLVTPVLVAKGAAINWRLVVAAYAEGLPVGAVAIVAYDLALKPIRRFGGILVEAIIKWVSSSVERGGIYGGYDYRPWPGRLGQEELEDDPGRNPAFGDGVVRGSEQGGISPSPP